MTNFEEKVLRLMLQNRRETNGYQYTLPSTSSYPYQWFWDSCFHAIILSYFNLLDAKKEIRSLVSKQFPNGMIPHMIYWQKKSDNDFPVIHWGKKDTSSITQPPLLAYAVWQVYQQDHDKVFLEEMYPYIEKLHHYLLSQRDPHHVHLVSIINPDESGEDNSPRFDIALGLPPHQNLHENFEKRLTLIDKNRTCNFNAPFCMKNFFWVKDVPFNAIFVESLTLFSHIARELSRKDEAEHIIQKAREVKEAMRSEMLENGIFYSLYFDSKKTRYEKIRVKTWAIFAPLFGGIATQKEADYLVKTFLLDKESFATPYGIPTVSLTEPSFDAEGFWRGPVWIATNWILVKGLQRYGYNTLAEKIKKESLQLIEKDGFREQFDPLTGKGLGAHHFTWGGLILDM